VDGDPGIDARTDARRAAFPLNMVRIDVTDSGSALGEPIAADARDVGDGFSAAFLKLVAGLLDVRYDQLRQREVRRRQRRWGLVIGSSLLLAAIFGVLAVQATIARNTARAAQSVAELELQSERQTREFLLSIFRLADPNEARGNSVTVREILDRAVARIDHSEFSRAEIRARFLATMGEAYSSLGLDKRGVELLSHSIDSLGAGELTPDARNQRNDSRIELADLLYSMGEYDAALKQVDAASAATEKLGWEQRAHLENVRGDVLAYTEKDSEARAAYQAALTVLAGAPATQRDTVVQRARSLSGLALLEQFASRYADAEKDYAQVVAMLQATVGETHPETISAMVSLGSSAFQNGEADAARAHWSRALEAARRVFDAGTGPIATIENNLGRLMLETGDIAGAEPLLRDALASDRKQHSATFDDLAYPLYNLAIVRFTQGDRQQAQALLDEALPIAAASNHRMHGPILTALADLACSDGRVKDGGTYAQRAVTTNQEHADTAPWYLDQAKLTQQFCTAAAGEKTDHSASAAFAATLQKKWGEKSPFTQRALAQIRAIEKSTQR
jgi:tetratricopeptide (TPR) repeat protein